MPPQPGDKVISGFTDGGSDPLPPAPPIYLTLPPAHRGIGAHPRFLGTKASAIKPHTATRSRGRWRRLWTTFNSIPFNLLVALRPLSQLQNSDQASLFNMDRQGSALSTPGGVGFCGGQYYSTPPAPKAPGGGAQKGTFAPKGEFLHPYDSPESRKKVSHSTKSTPSGRQMGVGQTRHHTTPPIMSGCYSAGQHPRYDATSVSDACWQAGCESLARFSLMLYLELSSSERGE